MSYRWYIRCAVLANQSFEVSYILTWLCSYVLLHHLLPGAVTVPPLSFVAHALVLLVTAVGELLPANYTTDRLVYSGRL